MDDGSPIPIQYLISAVVFIIIGGWFAGAEISLASVNKIRMMSYADDGNKKAARVLYILDHFDKALATLLIGNNIMHLSCASVMTLFAQKVWGSAAVSIITLITTLIVFFFSEMIPKSFAKACSEKFALVSAGPLVFLMRILTPVSFLFSKLTSLIQKPLGIDEDDEDAPTVTEDELKEIIESIDEVSDLDDETGDLVKNVMAFSETRVRDIITPMEQVTCLTTDMTREQVLACHKENLFSRYPVKNAAGEIIGVLRISKYLYLCTKTQSRIAFRAVMDRPLIVDISMPIDDLLSKLSSSKLHLALVSDGEHGLIGIVTVEDILEELVGEIYDENDEGGERR